MRLRAAAVRERHAKMYAILKLQACARRNQMRQAYVKLVEVAVTLQAHARASIEKRRYGRMRHAAITIQQAYRDRAHRLACIRLIRLEVAERHQAATTIQRAYQRLQHSRAREFAAILIQRDFRRYMRNKREAEERQLRKAVDSAAKSVQRMVRGFLARHKYQRFRCTVITLQAHWRAGRVRLSSSLEMKAILERLEEANHNYDVRELPVVLGLQLPFLTRCLVSTSCRPRILYWRGARGHWSVSYTASSSPKCSGPVNGCTTQQPSLQLCGN
eukprot:scaffold1771_cov384-Prasinococcus_capsulatus_cf.AAC.1